MSPEEPAELIDDASLAQRIGARLRALRSTRKFTLSELSKQSGVSVSYLSAVEKGVNLPSLQTLARLTEALGVSIPSVLADEGSPQVTLGRVPDSASVVSVSHPLLQLDISIARLESGNSGATPVSFDGKDVFVYVVSGEVEIMVDGESYLLVQGDAMDARLPVDLSWTAGTDAVLIWSTCPTRLE